MENNQYPNNQDPMNGQNVPPTESTESRYMRMEDAHNASMQASEKTGNDVQVEEVTSTMAEPVGTPYDNVVSDETQVYQAQTVNSVESAGDVTQELPKTDTMEVTDFQSAAANEAQVPHSQGGASEVANNASVPPQAPKGKTKRKKHGNFGKFLAVLLIGALVGGAAGGVAGYQMAGQNKSTPTVTQQDLKDAPKDANGNLSVATIAEHAMPAVVSVYNMANVSQNPFAGGMFGGMQGDGESTDGSNGESTAQGYGSGVIISADGLIVTNYHVIEDSDSVVVTTEGDKEYTAEVLGTDASLDLAVLKIDAEDLPYVDIADSDQVKVGDLAVAIGNPLGSEFADTVTDGIISGVDRKISSENGDLGLLQTNASINSGNSGGALLNGQGQLVGINSMKIQSSGMTAVEGMGFAIPSNTVLDFVNSVKDGSHTKNSTKKAWIGITGYNMNESIARQLDTEQNTGILVAGVTEGSPAAEAGLEQADIIVGADGSDVETFDDLTAIIEAKQPGDTIELTVIRQGQTGKVSVTLGTQN